MRWMLILCSLALSTLAAAAEPIKLDTDSMPRVVLDTDAVPQAIVEDLGITAVGRTGGNAILAPSSGGEGASAWMAYYHHATRGGPWEVCEVNLQTKAVKFYDSGLARDLWGWMAGLDDRLYTTSGRTLSRFDPKTQQFQHFEAAPQGNSLYSFHWNDDGKLYMGTYYESRVIRFDPKTGEFHDYGRQGPEIKPPAYPYAYGLTGDATHIYTARGKNPWYLVALDKATGAQTVLREAPNTSTITVSRRGDACFATVSEEVYGGKGKVENFRLEGGRMTAIDVLPSEPPNPAAPRRGIIARDGWEVCTWSAWAGNYPDGMATFWFRRAGEDWQSVNFRVGGMPASIIQVKALPDGRIVGGTNDPYSVFTFDPKTMKVTVLGKAPVHVYDLLGLDGKLYISGYANAPVAMYDPKEAWTSGAQTPQGFPPEPTEPAANPHFVAYFNNKPLLQKRSESMALGADGRIYVGCTAERENTGGALCWYDPKDGTSGGTLDGFRTQGVSEVLAVNEGKTILVSTHFIADPDNPKAGDGQAHVMAYDVAQKKFVGDVVPVAKARQWSSSGLVEWQPGKVIGRIQNPVGDGTIFYVLDVATMKVEGQVVLAGNRAGTPVKMADGTLYLNCSNTLVKLDPSTWKFTPVAKLSRVSTNIEPLDDCLYFASGAHLMRVKIK